MNNKEELIKIIKGFANKKMLVVGDLFLDHFTFGEVDRVNPEQPAAPLMNVKEDKYILGGAGNVANNLASLNAQVTLIGLLGYDIPGSIFRKECSKNNIMLTPLSDGRPTIVKQRFIAHNQQITRIDREQKHQITSDMGKMVLHTMKNGMQDVDAVILSDYNKGLLIEPVVKGIIEHANSNDIKVYSEVKPINALSYKNATLIKCNYKEAQQFTGIVSNGKTEKIVNIGKAMMNSLSPDFIVVTLSEKGLFSYDKDGKYAIIPTKARSVVDVTGAGDTAISILALASLDLDIHSSAHLANQAAGIVVEKVGTATISQEELINSLE